MNIKFEEPILPGSISVASSRCGKQNCSCKSNPPVLHGPFYRWTGFINGKRTTRTLSKTEALECRKRIKNLRKVQKMLDKEIQMSLENAPWTKRS